MNILISRLKKITTIFLIRERCSLFIIAKNKGFMPFSVVNGDEKSFFRFCDLDKKTVVFGPAKTTANEGEILNKL